MSGAPSWDLRPPSAALVCQAPLGAGRTLASSGHGLFCSPLPHPHPHPHRQKGEQENTGKFQEQDACELARNFISGAEVCPEASHIQVELPPRLERLLIFNTEVCGFTIGPSRQSQRASPRQRLRPNRKNTSCGCQPGMLVNVYQPALPGGVGYGRPEERSRSGARARRRALALQAPTLCSGSPGSPAGSPQARPAQGSPRPLRA